MRDYEIELIAALVEGRLEDESEARALIASGPEFQTEYESQKLAYDALSSLGSATLSTSEKAALHRDIWTELRSGQAPKPARSPWYYRWAPVAAGMFVVVGLVAVISQGGAFDGAGDAETFQEASGLDAGGVTTTAADSGDTMAEEADAADGDDASEAPITGGAAADFARTLSPTEEQFFADEAAKIRAGDLAGADLTTFDEEAPGNDLQNCVDATELSNYEVVGVSISPFITGESAEELPDELSPFIAAIPSGANIEDASVAFVDLFSCELVHVED